MTLRARWFQAGGLLALAVVLIGNADLRPLAECGGETGLQPGVCIPYSKAHAVPSLVLGLLLLAGGVGMLWWMAGRWAPEHAVTLRFLILLVLASAGVVAAAWSLGSGGSCVATEGASTVCVPSTPAWAVAAYVLGGVGLGMATAAALVFAFLRARA